MAKLLSRRAFLTGSATVSGLIACSQQPAIQVLQTHPPQSSFTRKQINQLPYASIGVTIANAPRSLLILGRIDNRKLHWISSNRSVIVTQHGRVVRTYGFQQSLQQTIHQTQDPLSSGLHKLSNNIQYSRLIDIEPGGKFGIPIESKFSVVGKEEIEILEVGYNTMLIKEECHAPLLNWQSTNYYWADLIDGFIWKSRQKPTPLSAELLIEVFKPLGNAVES